MKKQYLHYLNEIMSHQWDDLALSDYGEETSYTFGQLAEKMLKMHTLFKQLGIEKGDKIALCGRNCANWAVAYLAIVSYGAVVVSILQDFKAEDIQKLIHRAKKEANPLYPVPVIFMDKEFSCIYHSLLRHEQ